MLSKTELDLQAIRERCEAATLGPWRAGRPDMATYVDGSPSKWVYAGDKYIAISSGYQIEPWEQVIDNAEFIAQARTDIPALLAEVERLQARIAQLEQERRWVPTTEGLPGAYHFVIVTNGVFTRMAYLEDGAWCLPHVVEFEALYNTPVTYWMPLPKPPEGVTL